jgi:serine/threonine protein kinase
VQGSPFPEFEIGAVLDGRFEVLRLLGRGAMGIVLEAKHLGLRQKVALKVLRPDVASSPAVVARFVREAHAAARLKSEHVVRIMDVGKLASGVPYIVMERLEGTDLARRLLERRRLGFEEVTDYLFQALEALAEAHRAGVIHRDLKPANLFVARLPGHAHCLKVLDFGISKLSTLGATTETELTTVRTVLGSPLYMSPEQLEDARNVEPASDIWSLGVIAYELLTGSPPYQADTMPELLEAARSGERAPLAAQCPELPAELAQVIERCLEPDLDRRFASAKALTVALAPWANTPERMVSIERILHARSSQPARPSDSRSPEVRTAGHKAPSERQRREPERNTNARSRAPLLAAGVLLAGVCTLAWLATRSGREAKPSPTAASSDMAPLTRSPTPAAVSPLATSPVPSQAAPAATMAGAPVAERPAPVETARKVTSSPQVPTRSRHAPVPATTTAKAPHSAPARASAPAPRASDELEPMPARPLDKGNPFQR